MLTIAAMSRSRDRGADAGDLGNRIGDAVQTLSPAADQLLEARARIVMEQKVEAGTGKPRQLAMVAEGRADHENIARRADTPRGFATAQGRCSARSCTDLPLEPGAINGLT